MKAFSLKQTILSLCLLVVSAISVGASIGDREETSQPGFYPVIVNGRILSGPNSLARSGAFGILVPVSPIAAALGDNVEVNAAVRTVTIRRPAMISVFDGVSGQVRENASPVLTISNTSSIMFANADELMLPIEIAAALFDASMRLDTVKNTVIVSRGVSGSSVVSKDDDRKSFELYQVGYEFGVSRFTNWSINNLVLTAAGRLFDGRFLLDSNASGSLRSLTPRRFSFDLERPNGQRFSAGDLGTGSMLPLMTANIRGAMAAVPFGRFTVSAFGGKAESGTIVSMQDVNDLDPVVFRSKPRFDSIVFGSSISTEFQPNAKPLKLSAGAMRFSGAARSGSVASASAIFSGSRLRMQADTGIGSFDGNNAENRKVDGTSAAFDISGTYQIADELSLHGRVTQIGRDFLAPQSGIREPVDFKAAGLSWSPTRWLSTTFNASSNRRPDRAKPADKYVSGAFAISPGAGKPRIYLSHSQNSSALIRSGSFTSLKASQDFRRWRIFITASRIKAIGPATTSVIAGANITINEKHALELGQGIATGGRLSGTFDWRASGLLSGKLSLSAGGGYSQSTADNISVFQRLNASLKLPQNTSLQVNYIHTANAGPTVMVQLRGSLFRKREAGAFVNSPIAEAKQLGTVSGRVFQDVDGDGRYEPGIDKPQAGVKVRIDGNRYVESDINGNYRFDAVTAGGHRLHLDLLSLRADLTILDGAARDLSLNGGQTITFDFRVARTGRMSGRVWLDANSNATFDEGEQPLEDVRVVSSGGRDTLTDQDGIFSLADLAPGEHVILIDEKTLPERLVPRSRSHSVQIIPGHETRDVSIAVIPIPAEVKRFPPRP